MSHELRTPLTSVLGYTQLLWEEKGAADADVESGLATIEESGWSLREPINDVLDLSRAEAGSDTVNLQALRAGRAAGWTRAPHASARPGSRDDVPDRPG
jgi:signal transduction histidine kinase